MRVPNSISVTRSLWATFAIFHMYCVCAHYCSPLTEVTFVSLYIFVGELKSFSVISILGQRAAFKAPLTSTITRIVINRSIVTRSHINCCRGKVISITYFELPSMQSALYPVYLYIIFSLDLTSRTV